MAHSMMQHDAEKQHLQHLFKALPSEKVKLSKERQLVAYLQRTTLQKGQLGH